MTEYYSINFGNFNLAITISLDDIIGGVTKKDLIRDELRSALKTYHYTSSTRELSKRDIEDIYQIDPDNDTWDHIISTVWEYDQPKYKAVSIKKLPSCEGCRYRAHGQKAHMHVGGCLYNPDYCD